MRTIAGKLLQLFSLISDIIINKRKICCKSDSVARVKNWTEENISRPPGQINPVKCFLQETCRVASELFSPIQFFTLATESLFQQILLLLIKMSLITENNCRSSPAIVLTQRSAWVAFPAIWYKTNFSHPYWIGYNAHTFHENTHTPEGKYGERESR